MKESKTMAKSNSNFLKYLIGMSRVHSDKEAFGMSHHFETREKSITDYIGATVDTYKTRLCTRSVFQVIISIILLLSIILFGSLFVFVILYSIINQLTNTSIIVSLIGSASAFISSIFGLLTIVVKYIFPKADDENSMHLLELAISTDLSYFEKNREMQSTGDAKIESDKE